MTQLRRIEILVSEDVHDELAAIGAVSAAPVGLEPFAPSAVATLILERGLSDALDRHSLPRAREGVRS